MRVTIEGDFEQVAEVMRVSDVPKTSRQIRRAENAAKRKEFTERRQLVVTAFLKVRYRPNDQEIAAALLDGLRRPKGVTDADLKIARGVLNR